VKEGHLVELVTFVRDGHIFRHKMPHEKGLRIILNHKAFFTLALLSGVTIGVNMGGYNSGRRLYPAKTTVEDCKSLDANDFARWGSFKPGHWYSGTVHWTRNGNETGSCGYYTRIDEHGAFIRISYSYKGVQHPDIKVNLSPYTPGFGGSRYSFVCPVCCQRKRTLHIMRGKIACRLCHNLTYRSCNEYHHFDGLYKIMAVNLKAPWKVVKGHMDMMMKAAKKEQKRPRGRPRKT
jgi:hypothetical protein